MDHLVVRQTIPRIACWSRKFCCAQILLCAGVRTTTATALSAWPSLNTLAHRPHLLGVAGPHDAGADASRPLHAERPGHHLHPCTPWQHPWHRRTRRAMRHRKTTFGNAVTYVSCPPRSALACCPTWRVSAAVREDSIAAATILPQLRHNKQVKGRSGLDGRSWVDAAGGLGAQQAQHSPSESSSASPASPSLTHACASRPPHPALAANTAFKGALKASHKGSCSSCATPPPPLPTTPAVRLAAPPWPPPQPQPPLRGTSARHQQAARAVPGCLPTRLPLPRLRPSP